MITSVYLLMSTFDGFNIDYIISLYIDLTLIHALLLVKLLDVLPY